MTFEELDNALPNGFHDAKMREISLDLISPLITIKMDLLVGLPNTPDPDAYRQGTINVVAPCLFVVDPPDPDYPFAPDGLPVNVSGWIVRSGENAKLDVLLKRLPPETTVFGFFLDDWNSYTYIAGARVEFSWDDGGTLG